MMLFQSGDQIVPDLLALRLLEIFVAESELNTRFECLIEDANAVTG